MCDHHSQLAGLQNVMKYAARHDKHLPAFFRSKEISRVCVVTAWRLLEEERRYEAITCLVKGVLRWPFIVLRFSTRWDAPPDFVTTLAAAIAPHAHRRRTIRFFKDDCHRWLTAYHTSLAVCRLYAFVVYFPFYLLFTNPAEFRKRLKKRMSKYR